MMENSLEIPPDELEQLNSMIAAAKWRTTVRYTGPVEHQYVVIKDYPDLVVALKKAIKDYGFDANFGKTKYRYLWIGEHKYWAFITLVNRESKGKEEERGSEFEFDE